MYRSLLLLCSLIFLWVTALTWWIPMPEGAEIDMGNRQWFRIGAAATPWSYAWHHVLVLLPIIALSFERRIRYVRRWPAVLRAMLFPAMVYIWWDMIFTEKGVWAFNERMVLGPHFAGLPWEEWVWFAAIPFACLFIYENLRHYLRPPRGVWVSRLPWAVVALSVVLLVWHWGKVYSMVAFSTAALVAIWDGFFHEKNASSWVYLTIGVSLVPMLVFNGWLTGMFSPEPLVAYAEGAFSGWRLGTMPVEDVFFGFGYLVLVVRFYQQIVDNRS
jgi:lycopene cyclase domain-containing protein